MPVSMSVRTSGPLFAGNVPGRIQSAVRDSISELVAIGETDVKRQLRPGHGLVTGHYRRSIHGEIVSSMLGRVHDSGVVYGPWLEGVSDKNKAGRFKGYAMFRNATQRLDKKAKGVLQKHVARLAWRLG